MGVNKVVYDGETIIDITDTTATEETVGEGTVVYGADGEKITGKAIVVDLVQETGDGQTAVMSQAAVTAALNAQAEEIDVLQEDIDLVMENVDEKVDIAGITLDQHTDGLFYIFIHGKPTGNGLELKADVVEGDVIGMLDENNNIILTGALADGIYTLKYEMADGSITDVGTITISEVVMYTITQNLTNVSSNNSATSVQSGESFTAILTASDGYSLSTITVTMGGVDITSSAVSGGTITIANVTGDVVITAIAEEEKETYTNIAEPNTTNTTDWSIWCNDARAGSDGAYRKQVGTITTNYMEVAVGDTIRIRGLKLDATSTDMLTNGISFYDSSKAKITSVGMKNMVEANKVSISGNADAGYTLVILNHSESANVKYMRLSVVMSGTHDDVIITRNQEIV